MGIWCNVLWMIHVVAKHIGGAIRDRNDRSRNRRTDEVPFIAGCSHFTRKNTRFRAPASSPTQSPCNIMQPFQCDLLPQLQETHRTTHTGTTTRCKTHRRNNSRQKRPQPQPPHRRGTFHRRLQPLYTEKHKVSCSGFLPNTKPVQHSCSHSNAICNQTFKNRIELRTQEQPLVAKHIGGTIRDRNDRSRNRRTDEVPFIAGCSHFTRKNTRFRAPASSPTQSPCNIMQPFQCDLLPQLQETHRTTHTGTTTRCKTHRRNSSRQKRPQPQPPHRRGTFHRRLQPLYTKKHKVSCSGFLPNTKPVQHSCSHSNAIRTPLPHHSPSSPLPFLTTFHRHHFPSSPLPFTITSLRHHFPSSPLPFLTTSLPHHFPSSPLPFVTTSLHHHFPSSPLPFLTTSLRHHSPSSSLPFLTTSLLHHFPSSPLPFLTTYHPSS